DFAALHRALFYVGFLKGDADLMQQQIAWADGKPAAEATILVGQAEHAAYFGQLRRARKLYQRAIDGYRRSDVNEIAAYRESELARWEAETGNAKQAVVRATAAVRAAPARDLRSLAACAAARAGNIALAHLLELKLDKE